MIFGLGLHTATGEEWADDSNAIPSAEAQAFKRAYVCFGLGRYLHYCAGTWVDLDEHRQPKTIPALPAWATPEGWKQGLRPNQKADSPVRGPRSSAEPGSDRCPEAPSSLILQIEALAAPLGKRMYRGLLKRTARSGIPVIFKMQHYKSKCWHTCKPRNGASVDWMRRSIVSGRER
jgi:hypothetical protein